MDFPLACNCIRKAKATSSKQDQLKVLQGNRQTEQHIYQIHPKQTAICNYILSHVRGDKSEGRWEVGTERENHAISRFPALDPDPYPQENTQNYCLPRSLEDPNVLLHMHLCYIYKIT